MPVRLMGEDVRKISRLEFYPIVRSQRRFGRRRSCLAEGRGVGTDVRRLRSQAEQMSERIEIARSEAKIEARREWETELEKKVAKERASILKACEEFSKERAKYFAGVEGEVVKLALAIAARVLHREASLILRC